MAGTDEKCGMAAHAGAELTQARIEAHLPPVLAGVVHGYIRPDSAVSNRVLAIVAAGHGEMFEYEAAKNGVDWGLDQACLYGGMEFAELMVSRGARTFTRGLKYAIRSTAPELARYMIRLGAAKLNKRLREACDCEYDDEMLELLVEGGANDQEAFEIVCEAGRLNAAKLIMSKRDVSLNRGLTVACEHVCKPIAAHMIASGAKKCYTCGVPADEHWGAESVMGSAEWITTCAPNGAYDSDDA